MNAAWLHRLIVPPSPIKVAHVSMMEGCNLKRELPYRASSKWCLDDFASFATKRQRAPLILTLHVASRSLGRASSDSVHLPEPSSAQAIFEPPVSVLMVWERSVGQGT